MSEKYLIKKEVKVKIFFCFFLTYSIIKLPELVSCPFIKRIMFLFSESRVIFFPFDFTFMYIFSEIFQVLLCLLFSMENRYQTKNEMIIKIEEISIFISFMLFFYAGLEGVTHKHGNREWPHSARNGSYHHSPQMHVVKISITIRFSVLYGKSYVYYERVDIDIT